MFWSFGFVSDFVLRISNLSEIRFTLHEIRNLCERVAVNPFSHCKLAYRAKLNLVSFADKNIVYRTNCHWTVCLLRESIMSAKIGVAGDVEK